MYFAEKAEGKKCSIYQIYKVYIYHIFYSSTVYLTNTLTALLELLAVFRLSQLSMLKGVRTLGGPGVCAHLPMICHSTVHTGIHTP